MHFPWHLLADVVIGRIYYDNYIVSESVKLNVTTVDATTAILAVHETGSDGIHAGLHGHHLPDHMYNRVAIGHLGFPNCLTKTLKVKLVRNGDNVEVVVRRNGGKAGPDDIILTSFTCGILNYTDRAL